MGKSLVALRPGREHYSPQLAEEILADLNLPPRAEQASKQLLAALFSMQDQPRNPGTAGVLESHLRQMIDLSTAHGAQPVLVTYPMPVPDVEQVAAKLAAETGAELVDMRQRLEAAARSQPSEAFFIPDGHCSDSGYRIMGETAAAAAGRLLDP
jgi:hypothetical protein